MVVDLRQIAIATLWKKHEKKLNNETTKVAIRNGEATYKFADYCQVSLDNYTQTHYKKEGKEIKIDKEKIIADYCKANGIEVVKDTKENYSVEFVPSEKAHKEFNKMLKELQSSQYKNIAKIAENVKKIK